MDWNNTYHRWHANYFSIASNAKSQNVSHLLEFHVPRSDPGFGVMWWPLESASDFHVLPCHFENIWYCPPDDILKRIPIQESFLGCHQVGNNIYFQNAGLGGSIGCAVRLETSSTPAEVSNILSWRLIMKYFLRSFSPFRWFKKGSCQFLVKECAQYWLTAWRTKPAK